MFVMTNALVALAYRLIILRDCENGFILVCDYSQKSNHDNQPAGV